MSMQLLEHWNNISKVEMIKEVLILGVAIIFLLILNYISDILKEKYNGRVEKSNNKILKFIFKYII